MQLKSIIFFSLWFIRTSLQLSCIQCTSPIQNLSPMWDHSCLEGTLEPVLCENSNNRTHRHFQNCLSALYKLSIKGGGGIHIHRGCSMIEDIRHECEPPATTFDIDTTLDFFCRRTCSDDGCNRHTVRQIFSHTNERFNQMNSFILIGFSLISISLFLLL